MNESSIPPQTSSEATRDARLSNTKEYDTQAASSDTQSKRVGIYDRPEHSTVRSSSSMFSTILLLLAVLLAVYFLFFANYTPS
jgi:hypothetical protein